MASRIRCNKCGEELDATISSYLKHLRRHEPVKETKPRRRLSSGLIKGYTKLLERFILTCFAISIVFLLFALFRELRRDELIATPFDIPPDVKEYTGKTVAKLLVDRINDVLAVSSSSYLEAPSPIQSKTFEDQGGLTEFLIPKKAKAQDKTGARVVYTQQETRRGRPARIASEGEGLSIKMEIGGISLDSLVSYIKGIEFLKSRGIVKKREVITGDVIIKGEDIKKIIVRIDDDGSWSEEGKELESMIDNLAREMAFDLAPNYLEPGELAKFYSNNGKYERADRIYKKVIKENPKDVEAYTGWARVLISMYEDDDAIDKYKQAYEIACKGSSTKNDCTDVLMEWGIGLSTMNKGEAAVGKYEEAAKINPENPRIYSEWGYELYLKGRNEENKRNPDRAAEMFKESDKLFERHVKNCSDKKASSEFNKNCADLYNNWGLVLDKLERYEESIEKFKNATQKDPEYYQAYSNWGLSLYNLANYINKDQAKFEEATNKYYESISKYRRSLHINPKYVLAYNYIGASYHSLKRYDEAIKQYKKAVQLDPTYVLAYINWGLALEKLGKYDEAIEKYKKTIEITADYSFAYYNWAYVLETQGKYSEAIQKYKEVIRIDPYNVYAYEGWLISLEALLKEEKNGNEAKKIKGELAQAYEGWGRALDSLGRYDEATEKYKKADELLGGLSQPKTSDISEVPAGRKVDSVP